MNTTGGRTRERATAERLTCFSDAVGWARAAEVIDDAEHRDLVAHADGDPAGAQEALLDLRDQREALHTFLLAGVDDEPCAAQTRDRVKSDIVNAYCGAELSAQFRTDQAWLVSLDMTELTLLGRRLGVATGALLGSLLRTQISVCGRCSWMFLDPSPSRRRRWCSMAACGNRAKAQRHQRK